MAVVDAESATPKAQSGAASPAEVGAVSRARTRVLAVTAFLPCGASALAPVGDPTSLFPTAAQARRRFWASLVLYSAYAAPYLFLNLLITIPEEAVLLAMSSHTRGGTVEDGSTPSLGDELASTALLMTVASAYTMSSLALLCIASLCFVNLTRWDAQVTRHGMCDILMALFPPSSVMVSYAWGDDTKLPRAVARHFPESCRWLDVESLIPGTEVKVECRKAASRAAVRLVFVGANYAASENCGVELDEVRARPGESLVFSHPDAMHSDRSRQLVAQLREEGHHVFQLSDDPDENACEVVSKEGVMKKLIDTGNLTRVVLETGGDFFGDEQGFRQRAGEIVDRIARQIPPDKPAGRHYVRGPSTWFRAISSAWALRWLCIALCTNLVAEIPILVHSAERTDHANLLTNGAFLVPVAFLLSAALVAYVLFVHGTKARRIPDSSTRSHFVALMVGSGILGRVRCAGLNRWIDSQFFDKSVLGPLISTRAVVDAGDSGVNDTVIRINGRDRVRWSTQEIAIMELDPNSDPPSADVLARSLLWSRTPFAQLRPEVQAAVGPYLVMVLGEDIESFVESMSLALVLKISKASLQIGLVNN